MKRRICSFSPFLQVASLSSSPTSLPSTRGLVSKRLVLEAGGGGQFPAHSASHSLYHGENSTQPPASPEQQNRDPLTGGRHSGPRPREHPKHPAPHLPAGRWRAWRRSWVGFPRPILDCPVDTHSVPILAPSTPKRKSPAPVQHPRLTLPTSMVLWDPSLTCTPQPFLTTSLYRQGTSDAPPSPTLPWLIFQPFSSCLIVPLLQQGSLERLSVLSNSALQSGSHPLTHAHCMGTGHQGHHHSCCVQIYRLGTAQGYLRFTKDGEGADIKPAGLTSSLLSPHHVVCLVRGKDGVGAGLTGGRCPVLYMEVSPFWVPAAASTWRGHLFLIFVQKG